MIGKTFFHTHPAREQILIEKGTLDPGHVIVDEIDYKMVLHYLQMHGITKQQIEEAVKNSPLFKV